MCRMKSIYALLAIVVFFVPGFWGQAEPKSEKWDLGFETAGPNEKLPAKWVQFGPQGYSVGVTTAEKKSGNSSVLIEPLSPKVPNSFGSVALGVPVTFAGKQVELKGFLKYKDVTGGFVGLWVRIEGDGGMLQFDNMESKKLAGSADWTEYSIKLPLPEEAETVTIGALLSGEGKLWADDLQLLVDGRDVSEAPRRTAPLYKASLDKEFDNGSRIDAIPLTQSKITDLSILGKVWGFVKYYHPALAAGERNWDYELFRVLPKVIQAKDAAQRNNVLAEWVESLGPVEAVANAEAAKNVKLMPDTAWITERVLGAKLAGQLEHLRIAKRSAKSYYIGKATGVGNPVFKNEAAYSSMKYPDTGFRLLALFRYWNIIQYFFPNKNLIGENWHDVLPEFIPRFVNAANELEYKKASLNLIGRINDTHANIWGNDPALDKIRGVNSAPVGVTFVEDKAVVTKLWDKELAERSGLKIGDVIIAINGRKVDDLVKERLDLAPASNYPTKLRDLALSLLRTNENSLDIKFEREGKVGDLRVECFSPDKVKIDRGELFARKGTAPFRLIEPDIAYIYPGSLKPGEIKEILAQVGKTRGLIVDLRSYPSDFIVFSLGEYLMPGATSFVKFSEGSITTPGLFTFTDELKVGKDNSEAYRGRVAILINEVTQSQAEYTTMALRRAPGAFVIGSTTAGADGNVSQFYLPGGISTMISGIGVYYPDGKDTQRVGIIPDIIVKPTIKGIREGRDEVLERALDEIKRK